MDYNNKNWTNGEVIYAADLNHIESGISAATTSINTINNSINAISSDINTINLEINAIVAKLGNFTGVIGTVADNLKSINDNITLLMSLSAKSATASEWQQNKYNGKSGAQGSSANNLSINGGTAISCYGIRTVINTYLSSDIQYIQTSNNCYPILFAYNNGTYVGFWNGSTFVKQDDYVISGTVQSINVANFRKLYPTYDYRVVIMDTTATSAAPEVTNVLANYVEYDTLMSRKDLAAADSSDELY